MVDQWIKCRGCGADFLFSAGEQEFFREKKMTPPRWCRNCRAARRAGDETRDRRIADAEATGIKSTGVIERYDAQRGFGFIKSNGQRDGIFFHVRSLYQSKPKQITVGAAVEFIEIESVRKPGKFCAERVTVVEQNGGHG
jgi:cold shock CspA family protein